jgi:hypothetical protein
MLVVDTKTTTALKERTMQESKARQSKEALELWDRYSAFLDVQEGKQEALVTVLEGRGLRLSRAQRAAIRDCTDSATLHRWLGAAGTAASVEELLAPAPPQKKRRARSAPTPRRRAPGRTPETIATTPAAPSRG